MPESVKKSFVIFTYLVLILSVLLVFWQVRNFDFVNYDDDSYIYENPHVLNGLTADGVIWAFTTSYFAYWHPLTWLSHMLDCQLFGANPGRMHLVNLILHLANTLLIFAVLRKMTGALWPSAFVAAAFALHPMHVESVAWIAERKDVLSTLFLLLTLASYVSYVRNRSPLRYALTLLLFALGLLAKPMLVTLPLLLLLLDYWPLLRFTAKSRPPDQIRNQQSAIQNSRFSVLDSIFEKIPFIVLSIISSIITLLPQLERGTMVHISTLTLKDRIANASLSYAIYIGKLFWPRNLAVFYPFDANRFALWQVAMCVLLLLVISVFVIRFGRNRKYLPVGWFWFIGTLVPVIGIMQVGLQAFADRYTYIPYIGLFIIIAWGLRGLLSKLPQQKIALGFLMIVALTTFGIYSHRQTSYWKDSITLFSHTIEVTQNNYIAYNNRGFAYDGIGRYQDAIEDYKQVIRINPDYVRAHCNLGVTYEKLGRLQDAAEAYKQAVRIKPDYAEVYLNLGVIYYRLGRYQDAVESYRQAIKIKPYFALAHYNLGVAYLASGDKDSALEEYKILKTLNADMANELFALMNK